MPSARALRVIIRANSSSLPPRASAITTAASLADLVTSALIASSTLMRLARLESRAWTAPARRRGPTPAFGLRLTACPLPAARTADRAS